MKNKFIAGLWHAFKNEMLKLKNDNLVLNYNVRIANVQFGSNVYLGEGCSIFNSSISDCSYAGDHSFINQTTIGKFCSIGPGVKMGMGTHPTNTFISTSPYFYAPKDFKNFSLADQSYFEEHQQIEVGSDVWIGANAVIMDGVKIGHGAIVAASAVVTSNIDPYTIVGGIPAKPIKKRFTEEDIDFILSTKWWDKDINWLKVNFKSFHNIEAFKKQNFGETR